MRIFKMDRRICSLFVLLVCSLVDTKNINVIRQKRIVGGIAAAQPPEDDPIVFVNKNDRHARIIGSRDPDKGFYTFRGIRFGEPPTGQNRFQVKIFRRYDKIIANQIYNIVLFLTRLILSTILYLVCVTT